MLNLNAGRFANPRYQAGGTALGIIVGLIVGLGIAVVVAIMISKSSLPFTNKQAQPERAAASGTPVTDPNKPLYGNREPAREAAKNFTREPAPESAAVAPPTVPAGDKAAADKAAADKAAADKAKAVEKAVADARQAQKAAQKLAEKSDKAADPAALAKPESADEKWTYFLQAGAFREPGDAENAKAKLALMGFEANISERPSDSGVLYRVRVGPFNQLEVMTRARTKLSDNGVDVAVVRTAR